VWVRVGASSIRNSGIMVDQKFIASSPSHDGCAQHSQGVRPAYLAIGRRSDLCLRETDAFLVDVRRV
jgi:hypothetical protein